MTQSDMTGLSANRESDAKDHLVSPHVITCYGHRGGMRFNLHVQGRRTDFFKVKGRFKC